MHIRLLTEESLSAVHRIMDNFECGLWFESEKHKDALLCRICLSADKPVSFEQESQLLSVSTSGKNEASKDILGKIRELFRINAMYADNTGYMTEYMSENAWYGMGFPQFGAEQADDQLIEHCWSLTSYKNSLNNTAEEEWDELEKSVIVNLADEVKVWFKINSTEITIDKNIVS